MYPIVRIIYGVPITEKLENYLYSKGLDYDEFENLGFETMYHGSSDYAAGFLGEELGVIHVVETYYNPNDFKKQVSDETKEKVKKMVSNLPDDIKELLEEIDIYLIVGTS